MKLFKIALAVLVLLANLFIAQPSWADPPKLTNSPDYTEVNQALDKLLEAKNAPDQSNLGLTSEEIQQGIGELQLQKYILETARNWGQCRNETGQTLAVYAHKPKKSNPTPTSTLYYLGNGQITEDEWSCDGIYLPSGVKVAGLTPGDTQGQELTESLAIKVVPGSQLVAKTNPETGAIELNIPPAKFFNVGEGSWLVPNLALADIQAQRPNAPIED